MLSQGTPLLLFKPIRVSKADVIRMGAGEGKETTEKGKLRDLMYSISQQVK